MTDKDLQENTKENLDSYDLLDKVLWLYEISLNQDKKPNEYWDYRTELLSRLEQGENLKCCGNCGSFTMLDCPHVEKATVAIDSYCDKWTTDGMSRKERTIC